MAKHQSKIRTILRRSPKAGLLALLFVLVLCLLLSVLWVRVRQVTNIALPVGGSASEVPLRPVVAAGDARTVLVLNSYHRGYTWADNEMDGIVETLRKADPGIRPIIEYLDCKHFPRMEHFDRLRDLFLLKYRRHDLPVVIAADNPSLLFALRYRARLFPRAAIVFCGINGFSPAMLNGHANVTGVAELLDAEGTLGIALRNHPRTRTVFVVHDYSITGLSTRRETEAQIERYAGRVDIQYVANMAALDLTRYLGTLPQDSLVLALSYSIDKDGQVINHERISQLLSQSAAVPVYGLHEERLGYGIVGGSLLGGRMQGARAAELTLQVLAGMPASSIPVDTRSPTQFMFDHVQLERFGIDESSLPPDSLIVNQPVSFLAAYPVLVFTTMGIMLVLATGILVLGVNIYRRIIAEEEQQRLQGQLVHAQKMEAIGHLAGGIAHDFNNILTAIIGYASLLRKNLVDEEKRRTFVDQILATSERAARLVRNLLAFSRKQIIEARPTELNDIVTGIEKIIPRLIHEDIEFSIILRGGDTVVHADAGQIEHVLMNLCTNARDAMPNGGRLNIEADRIVIDRGSAKELLLDRSGTYGRISVSDTGVGMPEEVRKQIFEPFFTTKEVGKGTGLGLSMAYGIIKQHGGSITVYSEPGKGSTFRLYLPVVSATVRREAAEPSMPAPRGRETILLAEDEVEVRNMVAHVLRDAGYAVHEAEDGESAIARFADLDDEIDLLLTDVIMPKRNGREVFEQLSKRHPAIKVIFMSGYTADIIRDKGILDSSDHFLTKPVTPDQVLRAVRQVLDGSAPSV